MACAAARSAGGPNTTTGASTARRRAPGRECEAALKLHCGTVFGSSWCLAGLRGRLGYPLALAGGILGVPWPVDDGAIKLGGPAEEFELAGGYGRQMAVAPDRRIQTHL